MSAPPARLDLVARFERQLEAYKSGVCSEVSVWLGTALPPGWVELLVEKAEIVAAHDPRFRGRLGERGDRGRDWLWAFMRHWLAALLKQQQPAWYARLPAAYNVGHPLPAPRYQPEIRNTKSETNPNIESSWPSVGA